MPMNRFTRALLLCAPLALSCGSLHGHCTLVGCEWQGALAELDLQSDVDELRGSAWRACLNGACSSFGLVERASNTSLPHFDCQLSGPVNGHCFIHSPADANHRVLDPNAWSARFELSSEVLRDGDRWQLEGRAPDGRVLAAIEKTVTYRRSTPNGPDCAPTCVQAQLTP
ncbi:MAG: hypothetical protein ACK4N5_04690 [Myxococcales bacterium]